MEMCFLSCILSSESWLVQRQWVHKHEGTHCAPFPRVKEHLLFHSWLLLSEIKLVTVS